MELTRAPLHPSAPLEWIPLFGVFTLTAALIEFIFGRLFLYGLSRYGLSGWLLALWRIGSMFRNLSVLSGAISIGSGVRDILRYPSSIGVLSKLLIAGGAVFYLPPALLLAFIPPERLPFAFTTSPNAIVTLVIGTAYLLASIATRTAMWTRGRASMRIGTVLVTVSIVFAFTALAVDLCNERWNLGPPAHSASRILRGSGEIAYLLLSIPFGIALWSRAASCRTWGARLCAGSTAFTIMVFLLVARWSSGLKFGAWLYGVQHLQLLIDSSPMLYIVPLSLLAGVGVLGLGAASPSERQLGAGITFLFTAGYAPTSIAQSLLMALGALLILRTHLAASHQFVRAT